MSYRIDRPHKSFALFVCLSIATFPAVSSVGQDVGLPSVDLPPAFNTLDPFAEPALAGQVIQQEIHDLEAKPLELDDDGKGEVRGRISGQGDVQLWEFECTVNGMITVVVAAEDGSPLDTLMVLYDENRNMVDSNDDGFQDNTNSKLEVRSRVGHKYFVAASAYSDSGGAYRITVETAAGEDPLESASPIELDEDGNGAKEGRLSSGDDKNYFKVESPIDGLLTVTLEALGGELDTFLRVYDQDFRVLDYNDDRFSENTNSMVRIAASEGKTYYLEASAYDDSGGGYQFTIEGEAGVDPYGDAAEIEMIDGVRGFLEATLEERAEDDYFKFVAPADGQMSVIVESARTDGIDMMLFILDENQRLIGMNDDAFQDNSNAAYSINAKEGATYYVRASSYDSSIGDYAVTVVVGGIPGPLDGALAIKLNDEGSGSQQGEITAFETAHYYRIEVPFYGNVKVTVRGAMGSNLDPRLGIYDADENEIASNDDAFADRRDAEVTFRAEADTPYFIAASAIEETEGRYVILVRSEPMADPFESPRELKLDDEGRGEAGDALAVAGESHIYAIESPIDGDLTIVMKADDVNELDCVLTVLDSEQKVIDVNDNAFDFSTNAAITIKASEGAKYLIQAGAIRTTTGSYQLDVMPGGIPSPFDDAIALQLDDDGNDKQVSAIRDLPLGVIYTFVAKESDEMTIVMRSVGGGADTLLTLYDADREEISSNDDAFSDNTDAAITFQAKEGETYFIRASAFEGGEGDFSLEVMTGPLPSPFDDAVEIKLEDDGTLVRDGELESAGEKHYLLLKAPSYGELSIIQRAADGSSLDTVLAVYNSERVELQSNDDAFDANSNSKITMLVQEGQSIYIVPGGYDSEIGAYQLELKHTPMADPFDDATPLVLGEDGTVTIEGELESDQHIAVFRFTPEEDGEYVIDLKADASNLDTVLTLIDADRQELAANDDGTDASTDSQIRFDMEAGKTYFLKAAAFEGTAGKFTISIGSGD